MRLAPTAEASGFRLIVRDAVGSTNAEALALARTGEGGPVWIVAERQTAGRGRRGRSWESPAGNLYATLLLVNPASPGRAPELSFVAALAVQDALDRIAPELAGRITLKWPNDVLADGAKLAGILIEGESAASRPLVAAVGIGLNCAHHPADTAVAATDLGALGFSSRPQDVFTVLSATMAERLRQWDEGRGFETTRRDWLARAVGVGGPIRVRTAQADIEGIFSALDPAGRLVLNGADGSTQFIAAGEIFPLGRIQSPDAVS